MKKYVLLVIACCFLAGCHKNVPLAITQEMLVGSYVYHSEDPDSKPSDHNLDHLLIQSSGQYDLVQGGSTKAVTEVKGHWSISPPVTSHEPPTIDLDHAGYPIEIHGHEIRLMIDNDLGIWWDKPR